jgi:hypothetical protein
MKQKRGSCVGFPSGYFKTRPHAYWKYPMIVQLLFIVTVVGLEFPDAPGQVPPQPTNCTARVAALGIACTRTCVPGW